MNIQLFYNSVRVHFVAIAENTCAILFYLPPPNKNVLRNIHLLLLNNTYIYIYMCNNDVNNIIVFVRIIVMIREKIVFED